MHSVPGALGFNVRMATIPLTDSDPCIAEVKIKPVATRTVKGGNTPMDTNTVNIEIQAADDLRSLIGRAAAVSQVTLEEFVLKASTFAAFNELSNRADFVATDAQVAEFGRIADGPPSENEAIRKLLASRSPWE